MYRFNRIHTVNVAMTVKIGGAYTANDCVGGLQTINFGTGHGAMLRRIDIVDYDNEQAAFIVHLFDAAPTAILDDAAYSPTDANTNAAINIEDLTVVTGDYETVNGSAFAIAHMKNLNLDIQESSGGILYAYYQCTGTPTYTAITDLLARYTFWVNND